MWSLKYLLSLGRIFAFLPFNSLKSRFVELFTPSWDYFCGCSRYHYCVAVKHIKFVASSNLLFLKISSSIVSSLVINIFKNMNHSNHFPLIDHYWSTNRNNRRISLRILLNIIRMMNIILRTMAGLRIIVVIG